MNIKKYRIKSNLTQRELAEKLEVPKNNVSRWERGEHKPNVFTVMAIARVLRCSLEELMTDETE